MTKSNPQELRKQLHDYYESTLEETLWDRIGISHYTYLKFMNGAGAPHLKTMVKVKRFLESSYAKDSADGSNKTTQEA